jgi:hypothetical protein
MFGILAGKKTYITAILGILGALGGHLTGDIDVANTAQLILTSILGMTIRNSIGK